MTRRTFKSALDGLLLPLGFERHGKDWIRRKDGFEDVVSMQVVTHLGTTANISTIDLTSEAIFFEAIPRGSPGLKYPTTQRLHYLMDRPPKSLSLWWHADSGGPEDMAEAIRAFALPFFEKMRSLEAQALHFGRASTGKWGPAPQQLYLAIALYRMGELEEACRSLARAPANLWPSWRVQVDALRRRLGCNLDDCAT